MEEKEQNKNQFSWPRTPKTEAEFEALMMAVDQSLAEEGVPTFQRPIHLAPKLWDAFKWEGRMLPPRELADLPGYSGEILMAKAHRWYEETYGNQLKSDWAHGFVPVKLGNSLWRMRAPVMYGTVRFFINRNLENRGARIGKPGVPATLNVLCEVEKLTQGLADRLPESALVEHIQFHVFALENLQWRDSLPHTELFSMARADYDQCTADVLARRFGQARWGAQQAVEKTLKGLLSVAVVPFPTGGPNGHSLKHLASLLKEKAGVSLSDELLELATCSPKVRYGEEPSSETQALSANHAVLGILEQLRNNSGVLNLLAGEHRP